MLLMTVILASRKISIHSITGPVTEIFFIVARWTLHMSNKVAIPFLGSFLAQGMPHIELWVAIAILPGLNMSKNPADSVM